MKSLNDAKLIVKLAVPVAAALLRLCWNGLPGTEQPRHPRCEHAGDRRSQRTARDPRSATCRCRGGGDDPREESHHRGWADRRVLGDEHANLEKKATQAVGSLVQLSDTPERRAINEQLRDLTARFFATSRRAVDLGLVTTRRLRWPSRPVRDGRREKALLEALDKRVAANVADLEAKKHRAEEVAADAARTLTVLASAGLLAASAFSPRLRSTASPAPSAASSRCCSGWRRARSTRQFRRRSAATRSAPSARRWRASRRWSPRRPPSRPRSSASRTRPRPRAQAHHGRARRRLRGGGRRHRRHGLLLCHRVAGHGGRHERHGGRDRRAIERGRGGGGTGDVERPDRGGGGRGTRFVGAGDWTGRSAARPNSRGGP